MSYTHLTEKDRCAITYLRMTEVSLRDIARRLGRHHTSISRESGAMARLMTLVLYIGTVQPILELLIVAM